MPINKIYFLPPTLLSAWWLHMRVILNLTFLAPTSSSRSHPFRLFILLVIFIFFLQTVSQKSLRSLLKVHQQSHSSISGLSYLYFQLCLSFSFTSFLAFNSNTSELKLLRLVWTVFSKQGVNIRLSARVSSTGEYPECATWWWCNDPRMADHHIAGVQKHPTEASQTSQWSHDSFLDTRQLWCQYISNTVQCSAYVMPGMITSLWQNIRNIYVSISVKWIRTISNCNQDLVCHIQVACLSSSWLRVIKNGEKWECCAKCGLKKCWWQ